MEMYPSTDDLKRVSRPDFLGGAHSGGPITDVQLHPEMPVVATCGEDRYVSVWRTNSVDDTDGSGEFFTHDESRQPVHITFGDVSSIPLHLHWYSGDRNKLVAGLADGNVALFDVATEKLVTTIRPPQLGAMTGVSGITSVGESLFVSYANGSIRMMDFSFPTGDQVLTQVGEPVSACALVGDSKTLVTGTVNGTVQLWDVADLDSPPVQRISLPENGTVTGICSFGTRIAVSSTSGDVLLYKQ
jgi:WD40 repeat protein